MKNVFFILATVFFLASCEKMGEHHKKDKPCAVVSTENVPSSVTKSFEAKYPATKVDTWFNKDNKGFAAAFKVNNKKSVAVFDNDGNFQNEINDDQQGDHQDNDEGCGCETEDGD